MDFTPTHTGLFFGQKQLGEAREMRESSARQAAWALLVKRDADQPLLWRIMRLAYRFRLLDDAQSGAQALELLQQAPHINDDAGDALAALRDGIAQGQLLDMLSAQPDFAASADNQRTRYRQQADAALQAVTTETETDVVLACWCIALQVAAGAVLDDAALFEAGVKAFRQRIDSDIHPEGYVKSAVENQEQDTLYRQVMSVAGLVLAAEAAHHAGADLWTYENRGVGVSTAVAYAVYYYFFPDKWRWQQGITTDDTHALFEQYGAFIEIASYRKPARGVEYLLEEQRPFMDVHGGGFTTLTHGPEAQRKRGLRLFKR
jgi:hypothetical protein